jgi:DHA1 family multidrug resistance protein-like MFS transporter
VDQKTEEQSQRHPSDYEDNDEKVELDAEAHARAEAEAIEPSLTRQLSQPYTQERLEVDEELELERTKSRPISLHKSADGTVLVDWYTTDDPANPQNWSKGKKVFVLTQIWCVFFSSPLSLSAMTSSPN